MLLESWRAKPKAKVIKIMNESMTMTMHDMAWADWAWKNKWWWLTFWSHPLPQQDKNPTRILFYLKIVFPKIHVLSVCVTPSHRFPSQTKTPHPPKKKWCMVGGTRKVNSRAHNSSFSFPQCIKCIPCPSHHASFWRLAMVFVGLRVWLRHNLTGCTYD